MRAAHGRRTTTTTTTTTHPPLAHQRRLLCKVALKSTHTASSVSSVSPDSASAHHHTHSLLTCFVATAHPTLSRHLRHNQHHCSFGDAVSRSTWSLRVCCSAVCWAQSALSCLLGGAGGGGECHKPGVHGDSQDCAWHTVGWQAHGALSNGQPTAMSTCLRALPATVLRCGSPQRRASSICALLRHSPVGATNSAVVARGNTGLAAAVAVQSRNRSNPHSTRAGQWHVPWPWSRLAQGGRAGQWQVPWPWSRLAQGGRAAAGEGSTVVQSSVTLAALIGWLLTRDWGG
jgi:hypothetical protein